MKILGSDLSSAINCLNKGELVIFPTETVYGLGANALDEKAVSKIFQVKNRMNNNPLIVHLKNKKEISRYAYVLSPVEQKLIDSFMPGPFTLILKKKDIIPSNVTAYMDTVGIRVPIDEIAHRLLNHLDYPLAAPSANISTRPSGTKVMDIYDEFEGKVSCIIDGGESKIGLESTVVKVIDDVPTILRPGFITKEDIIAVIGNCNVSEFVLKEAHGMVESPGMLYKHYAPKTPCVLVDADKIDEVINDNVDKKIIILASSKFKNKKVFKYINYGDDLVTIAHNIFNLLRQTDKLDSDLIIIEATTKEGLGLAIMNRLIRTCSYNYVQK